MFVGNGYVIASLDLSVMISSKHHSIGTAGFFIQNIWKFENTNIEFKSGTNETPDYFALSYARLGQAKTMYVDTRKVLQSFMGLI